MFVPSASPKGGVGAVLNHFRREGGGVSVNRCHLMTPTCSSALGPVSSFLYIVHCRMLSLVICSRWSFSSLHASCSPPFWSLEIFLPVHLTFSGFSLVSLLSLWSSSVVVVSPSLMVFFWFLRNTSEILDRTLRDHHTVGRYCVTLSFE